uniref:protein shisa-9 n=1 Tax=Myxine glutinosa TaxID=7769 RepID=UPI00358E09BA
MCAVVCCLADLACVPTLLLLLQLLLQPMLLVRADRLGVLGVPLHQNLSALELLADATDLDDSKEIAPPGLCKGYFDVMGQWDEPFLCKDPPYLFCCGTCGFRYCCLEWLMSLDQSMCRNRSRSFHAHEQGSPTHGAKAPNAYDPTRDKTHLIVYIVCGVVALILLLGIFTKVGIYKPGAEPPEGHVLRLTELLRHEGPACRPGTASAQNQRGGLPPPDAVCAQGQGHSGQVNAGGFGHPYPPPGLAPPAYEITSQRKEGLRSSPAVSKHQMGCLTGPGALIQGNTLGGRRCCPGSLAQGGTQGAGSPTGGACRTSTLDMSSPARSAPAHTIHARGGSCFAFTELDLQEAGRGRINKPKEGPTTGPTHLAMPLYSTMIPSTVSAGPEDLHFAGGSQTLGRTRMTKTHSHPGTSWGDSMGYGLGAGTWDGPAGSPIRVAPRAQQNQHQLHMQRSPTRRHHTVERILHVERVPPAGAPERSRPTGTLTFSKSEVTV